MPDKYFFISPEKVHESGIITVEGEEAHHMLHVVRLRPGDSVSLLDGKGKVYRGVLRSRGRNSAEVEVVEVIEMPPPGVDIAVGVIKEQRLSWAVEKCTEIGIGSFIPFVSKRSVWSGDTEKRLRKTERLRRKAMAACKQAGQAFLPDVKEVLSFEALLDVVKDYGFAFLADKDGIAVTSVDDGAFASASNGILGIVGPEGGLEEFEREALLKIGVVPLNLGSSTLRSETAASCLAFLLNYGLLTRGFL